MTQIVISSEQAKELDNSVRIIRNNLRVGAQSICNIGQELIKVKALLHDQGSYYRDWIEDNFDMSYKTAQRYEDVARQFGLAKLSDWRISVSALYLLAGSSIDEPTRQKYIARLEAGDTVSHQEVNADLTEQKKRKRESKMFGDSVQSYSAVLVKPKDIELYVHDLLFVRRESGVNANIVPCQVYNKQFGTFLFQASTFFDALLRVLNERGFPCQHSSLSYDLQDACHVIDNPFFELSLFIRGRVRIWIHNCPRIINLSPRNDLPEINVSPIYSNEYDRPMYYADRFGGTQLAYRSLRDLIVALGSWVEPPVTIFPFMIPDEYLLSIPFVDVQDIEQLESDSPEQEVQDMLVKYHQAVVLACAFMQVAQEYYDNVFQVALEQGYVGPGYTPSGPTFDDLLPVASEMLERFLADG
ncbi:MAG: hypothetical protein HC880_03120 [Bacteroidia bacterium]|nr:hypothetical protein [Bacteroidia bacterium]